MRNDRLYQYTLVAIFFLLWGFVFLDRLTISFLAPIIKPALQINDAQVGLMNSAMTASFALSAIIVGYFSDKAGRRKPFLLGAIIGVAFFSLLSALTSSYEWLLVFRAAAGACGGPVFTLMMAVLAGASTNNFGANAGIATCGSAFIGKFIGPIISVYAATRFGWQSIFLINVLPVILCALLVWHYAEDTRAVPAKKTGTHSGVRQALKELFGYRNAVICMGISIFGMAGFWAVMMFGPTYWVDAAGLTPEAMSRIFGYMGLMSMMLVVVVPKLSDHFGRRPILIASYLLSAVVPLSLYLLGNSPANIAIFILLGGMVSGMMPLFMSVIPSEVLPVRLFAMSSGIILALGEMIGGSFFAALGGYISNRYGVINIMPLGFLCFAIAAVFACLLTESNPHVLRKRSMIGKNN